MSQMSIQQAMELATRHYSANQWLEAESVFRQILRAVPTHHHATQLLAVTLFQQNRRDEAIQMINRAIAMQPDSADALVNRGVMLMALGDMDRAILDYRRAVELQPNNPAALDNLGCALRALGKLDESIEAHQQSTQLMPKSLNCWNNLGISLQLKGRFVEAADAFEHMLQLSPDQPEALENLGNVRRAQHRLDESISCLRRANELRPKSNETLVNLAASLIEADFLDEAIADLREALLSHPESSQAHHNLGLAFRKKGELEEAANEYQLALQQRPVFPNAWRDFGQALQLLGRTEEAVAAYQKAIDQKPDYAEAHSSLGTALTELQQLSPAIESFERAVDLAPDYALAHFNLGQARLTVGEWESGWAEQEWRWKAPELEIARPIVRFPQWSGEPLAGKRILLFGEQGFGDVIQCARYVHHVVERGGRVVLLVQPPLRRLLSRLPGIEDCLIHGMQGGEFDFECPLFSLPHVLKMPDPASAAKTPYLSVDPELAEKWAKILKNDGDRLQVGLVWAGRAGHRNDRNRSIGLGRLRDLLNVKNVVFHSLQTGDPTSQLTELGLGSTLKELGSQLTDFAETAAAIDQLDLVITVDTAAAHLAGALSKPVWVLLPFFSDWRYMLNRSDNPWYPTMRLFRQPRPGDWSEPLARVAGELTNLVK